MPAYAALSDLLARFEERELVQLTDDAGAGIVDEARIAAALVIADGTIDSHLAVLYQLPLARVPALLVDLACVLARETLWTRKGSAPEAVEKAGAAARRSLEKIAAGTLKIDAGTREQPARDGVVLQEGGERLYGRDRLRGF